jgi:S1-C subfamily serine protease
VLAAHRGVVRVVGTACGLGIEGSGWVAARDLVVTNAHVVAGETDTAVQVDGNPPGMAAEPVVFDPHDDIAVLRVSGLNDPALSLASNPRAGTAAGILGYPLDGAFDAEPGRIGQTETVTTEDAYGNGPVQRSITSLRGRVRPGNSGGPMVDAAGEVVATVFAAITGASGAAAEGGFAVPNALIRTQLGHAVARHAPVGTGQCAG